MPEDNYIYIIVCIYFHILFRWAWILLASEGELFQSKLYTDIFFYFKIYREKLFSPICLIVNSDLTGFVVSSIYLFKFIDDIKWNIWFKMCAVC